MDRRIYRFNGQQLGPITLTVSESEVFAQYEIEPDGVDLEEDTLVFDLALEVARQGDSAELERARIRKELLESLEPEIRTHRIAGCGGVEVGAVLFSDIRAALDRICPTAAADALREITRLHSRLRLTAEPDRIVTEGKEE